MKRKIFLTQRMIWPEGQVLPHFTEPEELDTFTITYLSDSAKFMLTVMQGLLNRKKTRIFLNGVIAIEEEGINHWPEVLGLRREETSADIFKFIKKYEDEFDGIVLYNEDNDGSRKYLINLAGTIAGIRNLLPVEYRIYQSFHKYNINLKVIEDLTSLKFKTPYAMYKFIYDKYWPECTKRLLVSVNPINHHAYIRDLAAATGAATIWLDPRKKREKKLLNKFLNDMKSGESIMMGWYPEERSGIGLATTHGISTIPADYYENATVYSGMDHRIRIPIIPKKPELENKIYIALFLSEGDNIQYCQHKMSVLWHDKKRGAIPINWTVSPGFADVGPGILNYYYDTSTPNDAFVSGPSGLGYALIYDSHNEVCNLQSKEYTDKYTKLTEEYLAKTGIRVITIWDILKDIHFSAYNRNCRTLYGATLEDWYQKPSPLGFHVEGNRLTFAPNYPAYAETAEDVYKHMDKDIKSWDGSKPLFLSGNGVAWTLTAENLIKLKDKFEELQPGKIEFLRGDHFFTLYNEANGVPFNLGLSSDVKITTSVQGENCSSKIMNGSPSGDNKWISSKKGPICIKFDFGKEYKITRYKIINAGFDMDTIFNTRSLIFELSSDGINWRFMSEISDNSKDIIDVDIDPFDARFARITITGPGADNIVRIGDVEIYGSLINKNKTK